MPLLYFVILEDYAAHVLQNLETKLILKEFEMEEKVTS